MMYAYKIKIKQTFSFCGLKIPRLQFSNLDLFEMCASGLSSFPLSSKLHTSKLMLFIFVLPIKPEESGYKFKAKC